MRTRARCAAIGLLLATAVLAAGCGGGAEPAEEGPVTLRFSWWGSDVRHELTQQVIDAYEAENPDVTIEGEFGDFSGYFDRLATQVAANDAPDVIQMDPSFLTEYAGRGALLDLGGTDIDTADFDEAALGTGEFEGTLYGIVNGINVPVVFANPALFAAAGVELPDDTTWTWDDFTDVATRVSEGSPDGVYGAESYGFDPITLEMYARQDGGSLFTDDGGVALTEDQATAYWSQLKALQDAGAIPPASLNVENSATTLDARQNASGAAAMGWWLSNQLPAAEAALGGDLEILRYPSLSGAAEDAGQYLRPSQFWTISARTEHPEAAADFVDYLANSEEAASVLLSERGTIPNAELREATSGALTEPERAVNDFITEVTPEIGDPVQPTPVGLGGEGFPVMRYSSEVLFERLTPAEAATRLLDEAEANLQ